jgi:hypothetical protein
MRAAVQACGCITRAPQLQIRRSGGGVHRHTAQASASSYPPAAPPATQGLITILGTQLLGPAFAPALEVVTGTKKLSIYILEGGF